MLRFIFSLILLNLVLSHPQFHLHSTTSFIVPINQGDRLVGGPQEQEIIVPIIQKDRMVGRPQQSHEIVVPHFENKNIAGGSSQQQYKVPIVVNGPYELVLPPFQTTIYITPREPKSVVPIYEENQSGEQTTQRNFEYERKQPQHLWNINNEEYKLPFREYKGKEPPKKFQSLKKQEELIAGKNHSNKIVGGQGASISDYPYQLSLVLWRRFHFCGAVLISKKWALTAAHCTYGRAPYDLAVRAGSSKYASGGELISLVYIVEHEKYFRESTDYDISLLELFRPISHKDAKPISLIMSRPKPGDEAVVTGWGRTRDGSRRPPTTLQAVKVPVIEQKSCKTAYSKGKTDGYKITDRMFCAGLLNKGGKDSCQGDSGGPIAVNGMLAGLVSWGFGCGEPDYPGVYTSIADLRDWVEETLFDNYSY